MTRASSWAATLALLALVFVSTTGFDQRGTWGQKQTGRATADNLLAVPQAPGHGFTEDDYVRPRYFQREAMIVFQQDDGYADFYTTFAETSDVIFAETGVRIRGSAACVPTFVGTGGGSASWAQLRSRSQADFEVMWHNDAPGAARPNSALDILKPGFSANQIDSIVGVSQALFVANGVVPPPRGMSFGGHRHTYGDGEVYAKHGIYYGTTAGTVVVEDTTGTPAAEHRSLMEVNSDPWPAAAANLGSYFLQSGMQRYGAIQNRYEVGRYMISDSETATNIKKAIDLAVQHDEILILGFHDFDTDDGGADTGFPDETLGEIMRYAADYIAAGYLESGTFEQAVARGTGYVWGELLAHDNFRRLDDIAPDGSSTLPGTDVYPLGWPLGGHAAQYMSTIFEFDDVATGAADDWKVWDLGADGDTVLAIYTRYGLADSTSYGNAMLPDSSGHVLIAELRSDQTYNTKILPVFISTTGVQSRYVDVTVTVMYCDDDAAQGFAGCRLFQYAENFADFVNSGADAYDGQISHGAAPLTSNLQLERVRLIPLFSSSFEDTVYAAAEYNQDLYYQDSNHGRFRRFAFPQLRPYILDGHGSVDAEGSFGNFENVTLSGSAGQSIFSNLYLFNYDPAGGIVAGVQDYAGLEWVPYIFRVPIIPGETDWIIGWIKLHRHSDGAAPVFTGAGDFLISDISATAGRG